MHSFICLTYIQYLQTKFDWSNYTTTKIAWRSLSCGLRRIGRHVLTTKICNDLLPTADRLKRMKYQPHGMCVLCGEVETKHHLFLCSAPSCIKWRTRLLSALRSKLKFLKTNNELGHVLCSTISDWFEKGLVDPQNYKDKYHNAIVTQPLIGWRNLLMGHMSQEWEQHQGLQVLLTYTIELWEERNQDVHGRTTTEQKQKLLDKHRITMQDLEERYKHEIQVVDSHIFSDFHTTISHDNPQVLANWISTRRPTIIRSARQAQRQLQLQIPPVSSTGFNQKQAQDPASRHGSVINCCTTPIIRRRNDDDINLARTIISYQSPTTYH